MSNSLTAVQAIPGAWVCLEENILKSKNPRLCVRVFMQNQISSKCFIQIL